MHAINYDYIYAQPEYVRLNTAKQICIHVISYMYISTCNDIMYSIQYFVNQCSIQLDQL